MNLWKLDEEDTIQDVNFPPKTEHEKKAVKEAEKEVAKEMAKAAEEQYTETIKEALVAYKTAKSYKQETERLLKSLGMKIEDLEKMM